MLVTLRARRVVLVVPFWFGIAALVCAALAVHGTLRGAEWQVPASSSVFALGLGWLAVCDLVALSVEQGVLRVWRFGKRQRLSAPAVAFGVRLRPSSRATEYLVFAHDGVQSSDLATHISLRGARRGAERIAAALLESQHVASAAAAQAVQAEEHAWQAAAQQAQRAVDEYYRSPTWKWSKRVVIAVVAAYVVGMGLYQWLSGTP